MQSSRSPFYGNNRLTLFCDQSKTFQRNLVALIRQWDKDHIINICAAVEPSKSFESLSNNGEGVLYAVDQDGERWQGAEAVPIIFKSLPFGKLAAAMYVLPGTMWVTKQLYDLDSSNKPLPNNHPGN